MEWYKHFKVFRLNLTGLPMSLNIDLEEIQMMATRYLAFYVCSAFWPLCGDFKQDGQLVPVLAIVMMWLLTFWELNREFQIHFISTILLKLKVTYTDYIPPKSAISILSVFHDFPLQ